MKIGILGGTFNPVHFGHLAMAQYVLNQMELDKICFLPNGQPPHKKSDGVADKYHRLQMVRIAIKDNDAFYVSDYEVLKDEYCYTIDTIRHFMSLNEKDEYFFIIGADSLFKLTTWKCADELKKICSFIVCDRKGSGNTDAEAQRLRQDGYSIQKVDMPFVEIDSTAIRAMVRKNENISEYTPTEVAEYILNNKLYI